jgi:uncharacterized protein (TIGR02118 family)
MIRITILYPAQPDARFDFDYYRARHAPLLLARLGPFGITRSEIDRGIADGAGVEPEYFAVAHLHARDLAGFHAGLQAHRAELVADIPNFTNLTPVLQVSEVLDAGA